MRTTNIVRMARRRETIFGDIHLVDDLDRHLPDAAYDINVAPSAAIARGLFGTSVNLELGASPCYAPTPPS